MDQTKQPQQEKPIPTLVPQQNEVKPVQEKPSKKEAVVSKIEEIKKTIVPAPPGGVIDSGPKEEGVDTKKVLKIVGIVVGTIVALGLVGFVVYKLLNRPEPPTPEPTAVPEQVVKEIKPDTTSLDYLDKQFSTIAKDTKQILDDSSFEDDLNLARSDL